MQDRLRELTVRIYVFYFDLFYQGDTVEVSREKKNDDDSSEKASQKSDKDEEMGEHIVEADEFMKDFFEEVNAIKQGMAQIKKNIRMIEENYGQALVAVGLEQGNSKFQVTKSFFK